MPRDRLSRQFGLVLRDGRVAKGLSQTALAAKSGVDRSYLGHIEAGAHSPTLTVIFRLAKVLRASPAEMIEALETAIVTRKPAAKKRAPRNRSSARRG
jgi:transcriptional regulator with XRE-family HTH domain